MKYSNCGRNSMKLSRHIETICSKMKNVSICYRSDPHASYPKVPVCPGGTPSYVGCCKSFTHQPSEKWWSESQLGWWHSIPHFFWETKKIQPCSSHHQPCSIANGWWFRNGIWASRWGPRFRGNYHRSMAFLWPLNSEIFIIFLKKH